MIKIVITGPESCGKSTLAKDLSIYYDAPLVEEFSREYLEKTRGHYCESDLYEIARGQLQREQEALKQQPQLIICDTGIHVIKIWSSYKYGRCDQRILRMVSKYTADLFLLVDCDIPYEEDKLRENPEERHILYQMYKDDLIQHDRKFQEISGTPSKRLKQSVGSIDSLLAKTVSL